MITTIKAHFKEVTDKNLSEKIASKIKVRI